MNMPGFTAESSCYKTTNVYYGIGETFSFAMSRVEPQSLRGCLLNCDDICAGDFIGACMPWCMCRCRGGKNCGFPS
jgi:hypothetical protein